MTNITKEEAEASEWTTTFAFLPVKHDLGHTIWLTNYMVKK